MRKTKGRIKRPNLIAGPRGIVWRTPQQRHRQMKEDALQEYFYKTRMPDLRRD